MKKIVETIATWMLSLVIDCSHFTRVNPQYVGYVRPDEFFVRTENIPEMQDCAISNYAHLIKQRPDGRWYTPELEYRKGKEWYDDYGYGCKIDDGKRRFKITIDEVVRRTFFPNANRIIYPTAYGFQRLNKSVQFLNGKTRMNRPVKDVSLYIPVFSNADIVKYMVAKMNKTYIQPHHEFINVPELPVIPKPPRPPKPEVLDDGTPIRKIAGLNRDRINSSYNDLKARATNDNYKHRKDKFSYLCTTMRDEWLHHRVNYQHFMNDNYYEYRDAEGNLVTLETEKDIFGMMKLDRYCPEGVCYTPGYINKQFRSKKAFNIYHGKSFIGYDIIVKKKSEHPFTLPKIKDEHTGYVAESISFNAYSDALQEARNRKADRIQSIIDYEKPRGYIPQKILDKLAEYPTLIRQGKIEAFEPSEDIKKKYGVTE